MSAPQTKDMHGNVLRIGDYAQAVIDQFSYTREIPPESRVPYRIDEMERSGRDGTKLYTHIERYANPHNPLGATLIGRAPKCEKVVA